MKKISLFLCLILVTCLLGCNSAKEPDPSSPENSRQEVSQPEESSQPRRKLLCGRIFFSGAGCSLFLGRCLP